MVDEKPAPNRKSVWMDGKQEMCKGLQAVGLGLVKEQRKGRKDEEKMQLGLATS